MIAQYIYVLDSTLPFPQGNAYRLYAWLLSQLPEEDSMRLHEQEERFLAQYLYWAREYSATLWVISLFGEDAIRTFSSVLLPQITIELDKITLSGKRMSCNSLSGNELLEQSMQLEADSIWLSFCSPASFRQAGRYVIYPQERLILQSAAMKWEQIFPQYNIKCEDALQLMLEKLHIVDYSLKTVRYPLKGVSVPSFVGKIRIQSSLPAPLQELWNALLWLLPYTGVGVKTTLGMGGIQLRDKSGRHIVN